MALVAGRWWVVYELKDQGGESTRRRFEMNAPADYAAAVVAENAFRLDLLAATDCVISSYFIYQEMVEDALVLPAGVQKENEAYLDLQLYGNPLKTGHLSIPGANANCFVDATGPGSNIVDIESDEIADFVDNFLQGGTALMLLSDGEQAESVLKGTRRHVKNSRG
jgi:hypothetical protein